MFKLQLKKMIELRGIQKASGFLVKLGFTYAKAQRFLADEYAAVKLGDLEKFCVALNCTPNDLLEWKPDANTVLPESHALNALQNNAPKRTLRDLVADIPAERLKLIENLLAELKN